MLTSNFGSVESNYTYSGSCSKRSGFEPVDSGYCLGSVMYTFDIGCTRHADSYVDVSGCGHDVKRDPFQAHSVESRKGTLSCLGSQSTEASKQFVACMKFLQSNKVTNVHLDVSYG